MIRQLDQFKLFLGPYLISIIQNEITWGRLKNKNSVTSLSRLRLLNTFFLAAAQKGLLANDKKWMGGFEGRCWLGGQYLYYIYKSYKLWKNMSIVSK
jgi:hypothetical protein